MTSRRAVTIQGPDDRQRIATWAHNVEEGTIVEFRKKTRSHEQNAKLHAMLAEVADQVVWYGQKLKVEDWKNMFSASLRKAQVVPGIDPGTVVPLGIHTSTMTIDEMSNMIEMIYAFGAQPEHHVIFKEPNNEASDDAAPGASDVGGAPLAPSEPAGETISGPAGSAPGKFSFEGDDLKWIAEYAEKGARECRRSEEPIALKFLEDMYPNYIKELVSADAVTALNSIKRGLELAVTGARDIDRIEEWIATEFLNDNATELEGRKHG